MAKPISLPRTRVLVFSTVTALALSFLTSYKTLDSCLLSAGSYSCGQSFRGSKPMTTFRDKESSKQTGALKKKANQLSLPPASDIMVKSTVLSGGSETKPAEKDASASDAVAVAVRKVSALVSTVSSASLEGTSQTHRMDTGVSLLKKNKLCFVTSIFAETIAEADTPSDVREAFMNETSSVDFFLFTNLATLPAPGWTKIVKTDLPYQRLITSSRWGKFMAWREEALSHCQVFIYQDGYMKPKNTLAAWRKKADAVVKSKQGIAQVIFGRGSNNMKMQSQKIIRDKKDLPENVNATLQWMQKHEDFKNDIPFYRNKYFAYDPSNPQYRALATFFWDHYSLEKDSWRDEPLWSYSLHHLKIKPLALFKFGDQNIWYETDAENMGFGGHTYVKKKK